MVGREYITDTRSVAFSMIWTSLSANSHPGNPYHNQHVNGAAFAALAQNGSIHAWGDSSYGGSDAPSGTGYTSISSNYYAFAALAEDGPKKI